MSPPGTRRGPRAGIGGLDEISASDGAGSRHSVPDPAIARGIALAFIAATLGGLEADDDRLHALLRGVEAAVHCARERAA